MITKKSPMCSLSNQRHLHSQLGPDWEWDDQDGGAGNIGSVVAVVGHGVVLVRISAIRQLCLSMEHRLWL